MASFDFGTYSEATGEPPSKKLSWRDDPEESLSDWTIVVSSAGEESTFHVHKAMLAAHHAQQSDYFKTEFAGSVSSLFTIGVISRGAIAGASMRWTTHGSEIERFPPDFFAGAHRATMAEVRLLQLGRGTRP